MIVDFNGQDRDMDVNFDTDCICLHLRMRNVRGVDLFPF